MNKIYFRYFLLLREGGRVRFDYPTLRKEREGWGTRQLVAGIELIGLCPRSSS
jgi:hypothetical protein